jgi:hypothetical protein
MHVRCTRSIRSNKGKRAFADDEYRAAQPLSLACGTAACNMGRRAFADEESARHSRLHFHLHAAKPLALPLARGTAACTFAYTRRSRLHFHLHAAQPLALPLARGTAA